MSDLEKAVKLLKEIEAILIEERDGSADHFDRYIALEEVVSMSSRLEIGVSMIIESDNESN